MANEEMKKEEMDLEVKEAAGKEIADEELDNVAGGAMYGMSGNMLTTAFNSCNQWKCEKCGTYKGTSDCPDHPKEGRRWCPDCKHVLQGFVYRPMECTYWKR